MRTHNIPPCYRKIKEILIMFPHLALLSTLIGSNYPCLELIFMVPKMFELLKFDCSYRNGSGQVRHILLGCKFEIAPADIYVVVMSPYCRQFDVISSHRPAGLLNSDQFCNM